MEEMQIHVSKPERHRVRLTNRTMVVAVGVLVVLMGAVLAALIVSKDDNMQQKTQVDAKLAASSQAFQKGDYTKALSELQGAPEQATSSKQKAQIYTEMAAAAASAGQVPQAIDYYEKKHEIDPDSVKQDAYLLGSLYERQGDKAKAIAQYVIAVEYMKTLPKTVEGSSDLQSIQTRINELKAGQ